MKRATKIWLIVSGVILLIGLAVFAGGMTMLHWDFSKLSSTEAYEKTTVELTQSFDSISVDVDTDDIAFVLSEDKNGKVVCDETEHIKHTVDVKDNALHIGVEDTRAWYERFGFFSFDSPKMTVYLPKKSYQSLILHTDTGSVDLPDSFTFDAIDISGSTGSVSCGASSKGMTTVKLSTGTVRISGVTSGGFDLKTSTGEIIMESVAAEGEIMTKVSTGGMALTDVICKSLTSDGSTGDILLKNVVADGTIMIERSTGDVTFDAGDADALTVKTGTGDVTGSLLTEKVFVTHTSTGEVAVPNTVTGGRCEISTSTGDIIINVLDSHI